MHLQTHNCCQSAELEAIPLAKWRTLSVIKAGGIISSAMTVQVYKELLAASIAKNYEIASSYMGEAYDIVGTHEDKDEVLTHKVCLVSFCEGEEFVRQQIDRLPEIALSGLRSPFCDKRSIVLRAFAMEGPSFELIQEVRSYKFTRATKGQFWGYAECRLVLVDTRSGVVYSNLAAQSDRGLFDFAPR